MTAYENIWKEGEALTGKLRSDQTLSSDNFIPIFKYFNFQKTIVVRFWGIFFRTAEWVTTLTTMHCSHFCSQLLKPFFSFVKQKRGLTTRNVSYDTSCAHDRNMKNLVVRVYGMNRESVLYTLKPDYKHDYKLTTLTTI